MPEKITFEIPPGYKPRRLDVALHEMDIFPSRSQAKRAIEEGRVRMIGGEAKARNTVRPGDRFEVFKPDPAPAKPLPEDIPIVIIHEDKDIIVIDKPAGMVVHHGAGRAAGTLVNAVLFHCRDLSGVGGVMRPGVVHRLDKDTSGVIVMAKNDAAHQSLARQFQDRLVEKVYLAIIVGRMPEPTGSIDSPIGRHPTARVKMSGAARRSRQAVTIWNEVEVFDGASLIEARPLTGRTHQIRVHLAEAGRPVAGDGVYGNKNMLKSIANTRTRAALASLERQALHAHKLTITHPTTGKRMIFDSPLPPDMAAVIEALHNAV